MALSLTLVNRAKFEILRKNRAVALKTRFDSRTAPIDATQGTKPGRLTPLLVSAAIRLE